LQGYYACYEDSLRRWGDTASSRYDWKLFELFHGLHDPQIIFWVAKYAGRMIAGSFCYYASWNISYWHGAVDEEYFKLKAPHVLQYHIVKDALDRGFCGMTCFPAVGTKALSSL
jgi:hypothetical protein